MRAECCWTRLGAKRAGWQCAAALLLSASGALAAAPGTGVWSYNLRNPVSSSPALTADGKVIFSSWGGQVFAVDAASGTYRWNTALGGPTQSSPAASADGAIYIGCADGKVYCLESATGAKRWEFRTGGQVHASPAIAPDGTVYVGSADHNLYALNGGDGVKQWEFVTGATVWGSPGIGADATVYFGSWDGKVYALNGQSGALRWAFVTGSIVSSSPAIGPDGTVYIGSHDRRVYALDGTSGAKRWEFLTQGAVWSSPTLGADGTLYVGANDKRVYALDSRTGAKRWEYATGAAVWSAPTLGADGVIYFGGNDHRIYALNAANGLLQWSGATGGSVRSSPILSAGGRLYFGSMDGYLYAAATSSADGLPASAWPRFHQNNLGTGRVPDQPPVLTAQGQSQSVAAGTAVSFAVDVQGTPPFAYQWRWMGLELPGATNAYLVLDSPQPLNAGDYTVLVKNAAASVVSPVFRLVVTNDTGLVGHWSFDELTGSVAWDDSGYGNHGLITNALAVPGSMGGALDFNGSNSFVNLGNDASLNFSGPITLLAVFKPTAALGLRSVVEHGYALSPPRAVFFGYFDGAYHAGSWNGGAAITATAPFPIADVGAYVHLAGVYDGAAWRLYHDGDSWSRNPASTGAVPVSEPWAIGARGTGTERFFQGLIDDVRIYRRALAPAEIQALIPPLVKTPLTDQTVVAGATVTLRLVVAGPGPFQYQWQFNGANLAAQTNQALALANVQPTQGGTYAALVSNQAAVITNSMQLTVIGAPLR